MIKDLCNEIKSIDKKVLSAMFLGFKISLIFALIASYILALYNTYPFSHIAFESGILMLKFSFTVIASCLTSAFAINQISKS